MKKGTLISAILVQLIPFLILIGLALARIDWSWLQIDWKLFLIIIGAGMYEVLVIMLVILGLEE